MSVYDRKFARRIVFSCGLEPSDPLLERQSQLRQVAATLIRGISRSAFKMSGHPVIGCGAEALVLANKDYSEVDKIFWLSPSQPQVYYHSLQNDYAIAQEYFGDMVPPTETRIVGRMGKEWVVQTQPYLDPIEAVENATDEDLVILSEDLNRAVDGAKAIEEEHGLLVDYLGRENLVIYRNGLSPRLKLLDISLKPKEEVKKGPDRDSFEGAFEAISRLNKKAQHLLTGAVLKHIRVS